MTLFERLGGAEGVRRIVDELTHRLAADPQLGPLFAGVDGEGLRRHREHYLAAVLGGPEQYTGRGLREAHRPLAVDDSQFDRFLLHVRESARAAGTAPGAADELVAFLLGLRPVIVDRQSPSSAAAEEARTRRR